MINLDQKKIDEAYKNLRKLIEKPNIKSIKIENLQTLRALAVYERVRRYVPNFDNLEDQAKFAVELQNKTWDFVLSYLNNEALNDFRKVRSQRFDKEMKMKYRQYKKAIARTLKPYIDEFFKAKEDPIDKKIYNIVKILAEIR